MFKGHINQALIAAHIQTGEWHNINWERNEDCGSQQQWYSLGYIVKWKNQDGVSVRGMLQHAYLDYLLSQKKQWKNKL